MQYLPLLMAWTVLLASCGKEPASQAPAGKTTPGAVASEAAPTLPEAGADEDGVEEDCPGAATGAELVGSTLPEWSFEGWRNMRAQSLSELRGRVVVVRFWTTSG